MGYPMLSQETLPNGIGRHLMLSRVIAFEAMMSRRLGEVRAQRYTRLYNYYTSQNLPPDNVEQPLKINMFKSIVDKHASYFWGQWKKRLFQWRVTPRFADDLKGNEKIAAEKYGRRIKQYLDFVYDQSKGNKLFWMAAKNASMYGDCVFYVRYDPLRRMPVIETVLPEFFHCMWDVANMDNLTDVVVAYPIDRMLAREKYGTSGNDQMMGYFSVNQEYMPGVGVYWQHWSTKSVQQWIDDAQFENTANPYMAVDHQGNIQPGFIPFVPIANMRAGTGEFYGFSDAESVIYLLDELDRRVGDIGDMVNDHSHPILLIKKFTGRMNTLTVGPSEMWDMGREGEAERLEGVGPSPAVIAYIDKLVAFIQATSDMPDAAYGSTGEGQSHQTGIATAMQLMPVVQRANEKRIMWGEGLKDIASLIFRMMDIRDPGVLRAWGLSYEDILQYEIEPIFADILPKDELQRVNEEVATYANGIRSLTRSLEHLGEEDVAAETQRIKEDLLFKAALALPVPPAAGGPAGQNNTSGVGGSAAIPGGIGASAGKPGTMIKSPALDKTDKVN